MKSTACSGYLRRNCFDRTYLASLLASWAAFLFKFKSLFTISCTQERDKSISRDISVTVRWECPDRPDFAQDRQLRRRLQQSVHCGAARYRHTNQRNQSYRFFSTNDLIHRVSNFWLEILSKNISHCNAFLVSITLLNAYLLLQYQHSSRFCSEYCSCNKSNTGRRVPGINSAVLFSLK